MFPLIAKKIVDAVKARKVYAKWQRPARFDRNLVVIGAGSAGLVSAYIGAAVKAKVTLVERHRMGGDCLYTGCVPSKALIRSAKFLSHVKRSTEFGIESASAEFDFAQVMERVQRVIERDRAPRLGGALHEPGRRVRGGRGEDHVAVDGRGAAAERHARRTLATKSIVIAAGAHPFVPPIPGIDAVGCLTSDTVWNLRELPPRLVVLGGGPIGCELAQCFARLGSKVTQVEMLPRLMIREDPEISEMVMKRFRAEGVDVLVDHKAKAFVIEDGEKILVAETEGREVRIPFDRLLCAVGRVANTQGYGLEALGIPVTRQRTVEVNEYLQTVYPNIYACGDVAGPYQFTHTAAHTAWYAAVNALFGAFRKVQGGLLRDSVGDLHRARGGARRSERDRGEGEEHPLRGDRPTASTTSIARLPTARPKGVVKVLTAPGSDRILGVTIAGEHAGDLIVEYITAMKHGIGLNKILGTIHIYPTLVEANKYAAGAWKRKQVTAGQLAFLDAFHAWGRHERGVGCALRAAAALVSDKRRAFPAEAH